MGLHTESVLLDELTADPTSPEEGEVWYRTDTQEFRAYRGGAVVVLTETPHASTHSDGGSDEINAADLGSGAAPANYVLAADGVGGNAYVEYDSLMPAYKVLLDEVGSLTYVGEAPAGTATSSAAWRIFRIDETGSGSEELKKEYADGVSTFTKVWDNRATYTYSS